MYSSVFDGIKFVEGCPPGARELRSIRVEISGVFKSAQLKNLDDVKRLMADQAKKKRGNAIIDFKYGQKSVGFWASIFDRDDVKWYGEGKIAVIP